MLIWSKLCQECSDCIYAQRKCVFQPCSHISPPWLVLLFLQVSMELRHSGKNVRQFSNLRTVTQAHYIKLGGEIPWSAQWQYNGLDKEISVWYLPGERFFSKPQNPDWFLGPPNFLSCVCWGFLYCEWHSWDIQLTIHLHL